MLYVNKKGADQPAHPRIMISAFAALCLDCIKPTLAKFKISRLYLVSVAEQAGLSQPWLQTSEGRFSHDVAHI